MKKVLLMALLSLCMCIDVCASGLPNAIDNDSVKAIFEKASSDSVAVAEAMAKYERINKRAERFFNTVSITAEVTCSPRQHDVVPLFSFVNLNLKVVEKLRFSVAYIAYLGLQNADNKQNYLWSNGLGGAVSYRLYQTNCRRDKGLDARFRYGHSVGNGDLKYDLYDVGFYWLDKIGLGYRFVNSHTTGVRNVSSVYFSLAF